LFQSSSKNDWETCLLKEHPFCRVWQIKPVLCLQEKPYNKISFFSFQDLVPNPAFVGDQFDINPGKLGKHDAFISIGSYLNLLFHLGDRWFSSCLGCLRTSEGLLYRVVPADQGFDEKHDYVGIFRCVSWQDNLNFFSAFQFQLLPNKSIGQTKCNFPTQCLNKQRTFTEKLEIFLSVSWMKTFWWNLIGM